MLVVGGGLCGRRPRLLPQFACALVPRASRNTAVHSATVIENTRHRYSSCRQ